MQTQKKYTYDTDRTRYHAKRYLANRTDVLAAAKARYKKKAIEKWSTVDTTNIPKFAVMSTTPKVYTDETLMDFGQKHKGKRMADVPAEYFIWMHENCNHLSPGLKKYIEDNLGVFRMEQAKQKAISKLSKQ